MLVAERDDRDSDKSAYNRCGWHWLQISVLEYHFEDEEHSVHR